MKAIVLQKSAAYVVCGIVVTIPLIFGAVHPIVAGSYVYLMLVGLGSWLLFDYRPEAAGRVPAPSVVIPLCLLVYLTLQSVPMPLDWLSFVSPHRAERVRMVNTLAGTDLQWISLGESGPAGMYRSLFLLGVVVYYFSVKKLLAERPNFQAPLITCLVALGTIEALYGLVQFINPQIGILWLPNPERAAHGTIIYKNQYASMLNMIWPLALTSGLVEYLARKGKKSKGHSKFSDWLDDLSSVTLRAPLLFFAATIMILAVLFSLSRGGILAMVIIMLLLAITLPLAKTVKIGTVLVLAVLVGGYGALLGLDTIAARFDTLDNSGANRISIYLSSLPMLWDHWLAGIGVGSYVLLSPLYLKGFPPDILYDSAHNEYLELMIELGIPMAILLFAWMTAGILKLVDALVWRHTSPADLKGRVIGIASLCGLLGFFIHGLVDFGWRLPVNLIYCATLLALCTASVSRAASHATPAGVTLPASEAVA